MSRKIAFIGNQGGHSVLAFYAAMAVSLTTDFDAEVSFSVWLDSEKEIAATLGMPNATVTSFESFVRNRPSVDDEEVALFIRQYRDVNWSEVVAVERTFTDYSMLIDSAGERRETIVYVQGLVVNIVRYLEAVMLGCDAIVCQTADTLFSLIAIKLARHLGIRSFAIRPGTLLEPGKAGGFFANTEYLECDHMTASYAKRQGKILSPVERARTDALIRSIRGFGGLTAFQAATSKGKSRGRRALSPNISRLRTYLKENSKRDKNIGYTKIDPKRKIWGNLLRVYRKWSSRNSYGSVSVSVIPPRSIFFALHYQPEQSTLAQGIWHANQTALVENISKSLPLGYTLVVKEHPWGRGSRPHWQYKHLNGLYNVMFCDAPSKQIIQNVDAVLTVTGTVVMEALVFDKPAIMLGRNYFEFCDLIYRVPNIQELPEVLASILIDGDYQAQPNREDRLHHFLISYLDGLIESFPLTEHAVDWSHSLARELEMTPVAPDDKN